MNPKLRIWFEVPIIGFLVGIGGVWVGFTITQAIFIAGIIGALIVYFEDKIKDKIEPIKWGHGGDIEELESELDEVKKEIHKLKNKRK